LDATSRPKDAQAGLDTQSLVLDLMFIPKRTELRKCGIKKDT